MECCRNNKDSQQLTSSHCNTSNFNQEDLAFDNDGSPLTMSSVNHNAHQSYPYGAYETNNQLHDTNHTSKLSRAKSTNLPNNGRKFLQSTSFMLFSAEFFATFVFVYLGQSALTSFELIGTQNDILTRQFVTLSTYGLAYLLATALAINLSGAHLNPAYTIARALFGLLRWRTALSYVTAQYCGSYLAAMFLHATYCDKLGQRHYEGLLMGMNTTLRAHGNILSTGKLFSSFPPTEVSLSQLTISYMLASCLFTILVHFIHELPTTATSKNEMNIPISLKPFYLACALCITLAAFAANGGPVLNPAQDIAPRLYIASAGWGVAALNLYSYKYWWLCGLIAPHFGAVIGVALHYLLAHLHKIRDYEVVSLKYPNSSKHCQVPT